jgi:lactate permease
LRKSFLKLLFVKSLIVKAWSTFYLLTIFILIWSFPAFKGLFAEGGLLEFTVINLGIPGSSLSVSISLISATGTAILLAGLTTIATTKSINMGEGFTLFKKS